MSFGDGVFQGRFNRQPEIDQTVLGQYYDVPVVSLRAAAWRLMHAGIDGFKVDKVTEGLNQHNMGNRSQTIPLADAAEQQAFFYRDVGHPDLSKEKVLAELAIQPLAMAIEEVAAGLVLQERQDERLQGLPPPMTAGTRDSASATCYTLEAFKPLVKDAHGFEFQPERPEARTFRQQKWGLSGLQPGDWAELEVDTEQLGVASPVQHAMVGFVHLTSANVAHTGVSFENPLDSCDTTPTLPDSC
ncbi:hypothetical protein C2E21_0337 [Chlorella sorokiniana]|uniref:Uncharacterized protein n=1 Tax=Chlorella sorokiniana TaxID=3076 RepID=A0A2P6U4S4_CHLSO|nr:hypothetical protein C2E21_0337 [Chlorella sorokiniana]|eukprot:PRW61323.1 hypothetical protein C2E21_0337 [Chlorella sorokiniana]